MITLDMKTFLLHDVCHYVVEKNMGYAKGFWGMLAEGYTFNQLSGKNNPQTAGLRFAEQIVGPVQNTFLGNIPEEDFEFYVAHLDVTMTQPVLQACLLEIETILKSWAFLTTGKQLDLEWKI